MIKWRAWVVGGFLLGMVAIAVGGIALLAVTAGVVPIEASSGHWAITEKLLIFAKERTIAAHSFGRELPPLDNPAWVLEGAGHYEGGCKPCHGSPELRHPRVPQAMLPPPPDLAEVVPHYTPAELFHIVKHGIKFTGMPAWPDQQRDDEVRSMVAFLLEYPKLDAAGYRLLVHGAASVPNPPQDMSELAPTAAEVGTVAAKSCERCHGRDGRGREQPAFPRLAGQRSEYQRQALEAYAAGTRHSGIMQPIAAALSPDEMRDLARHYEQLDPRVTPSEGDARPAADQVARGRAIALNGLPAQRVPACASCHGPNPERHHAAYPELRGQWVEYLVEQLELFASGQRGGAHYAHLMLKVAPHLSPEQMRAVATFYATLPREAPGSLSARGR
ncbi:MAG: c-type cytochrome [Polyangiales bacterium]